MLWGLNHYGFQLRTTDSAYFEVLTPPLVGDEEAVDAVVIALEGLDCQVDVGSVGRQHVIVIIGHSEPV